MVESSMKIFFEE